jgi:uncharacterized OsmC-like protein
MSTVPTEYTVTARTAGDRASSITAASTEIRLDSAWQPPSPSGLPGPAELLAAALAGCLLKGLERARAMMPFDYETVEVAITAHRQDSPPKFTEFEYTVTVVTGESNRKVELLHRNLQQFGSIYNTLAAACDVHGTVVAIAPGD